MRERSTLTGIRGDDNFAGLLDRLENLLVVQRINEARVDHFHGEAVVLFQFFGRVKGTVQRRADGDDGQVLAFPVHSRLAHLDLIVSGRYAAFNQDLRLGVKPLTLEEDYWI